MTAEKYDAQIKKIRRELSVYKSGSVLQHVIDHLHWSQTLERPASGMPWICLFLLKLAMQECNGGNRNMVKAEFSKLANRLFRMQHLACPIGLGDIHLMMRPMVLQQTWYQGQIFPDIKAMTRQMIWYSDEATPFAEKFLELHGLSLKEFYLISLYLDVCVADGAKGIIGINLYELIFNLSPTISLKSIIRYFLLVAIRSQDLPEFFQDHKVNGGLHQQSEYFQTTPLRKKPVLLDGDNLFIYNSKLFSRAVGTLVPDLFKKVKGWGYKDYFGPAMEHYLGSLLRASTLTYHTEEQLNQCCRDNSVVRGKMADFLASGDVNIIFESKAIEPGDIVSSVFDPEVLKRSLADSFIKGIEQCQESVYRLRMTKEYAAAKFACIVVTHEDFWFASAEDIIRAIDPGLEAKVFEKYAHIPVPFDNILFVTVDAVENILQAVSSGDVRLDSFVMDCAQMLKTPEGKRFTMDHIVQDKLAGKISGVPILNQKADEWLEFFQTELDANKAVWQGLSAELIRKRMFVMEMLHRQFNR
ncbi:hypothetical protein ASE98_15610 [Pseudomonas sp. Leaf48]|uniref:GapS1 family protein n=1 Tax=Pseudomonas sp. Leaf48 TaxID=1736221 RepID=UPI00072AAD8E|nr:hypothetical protein [Pseudomonas sp. Leaf48]KQN55301.1 hypothetical protein ASE98_15610 [Pseudomonas sp. Leaf48]